MWRAAIAALSLALERGAASSSSTTIAPLASQIFSHLQHPRLAAPAIGQAVRELNSTCIISHAAAAASASQGPGSAAASGDAGAPSTSGRPPLGEPKPELVEQFLSSINANHKQRMRLERQALLAQFQRHKADTGSPEVTVAVWTHWLREQTKHFHVHPKNPMVMREFEIIMHKRRRLLAYLRDADFDAYARCIRQLGLADVFGRMTSADRYPMGKAHGDPSGAVDDVRRRRFAFHRQYRLKKTQQWKRLLPQLQAQDPLLPKAPAMMLPGAVQQLEPEARAMARMTAGKR